jgi:lauroyl/myristoyl acyltransferase
LSRSSWTPRQRWKNDAIFALAAAALKLGLTVPRSWLPPLGSALGRLAHGLFREARRTTLQNLELVHPEVGPDERSALAREIFRALGRNLTDTVALLDPTEAPDRTLGITRTSCEVLDAALAEGRGAIYATCPLGPWERMAALLASLGYPITTLARESYDPRFHELIYDLLRTSRNVEAIHRGTPTAPFAIVRALRRGRVLGFLVDLPDRARRAQMVTWLGRASRVPIGPARLALRTGAPIVVGTPAPEPGGKLSVRIERLSTADLPAGEEGEAALCQRIADALSERIRALPTQWPWMHPSFGEAAPSSKTFEPGRSAGHFRLVQSLRGHLH